MANQEPAPAGPAKAPKMYIRFEGEQRRQVFVSHLLAGMEIQAAYKAAGYVGNARDVAYKALRSPAVQRGLRAGANALKYGRFGKNIDWLTKQQMKLCGIDAHGKLWPAYLLIDGATNTPRKLKDVPRPLRHLVKGVKYSKRTTYTKKGDTLVEETTELLLHDQYAILRDLKAPLEKLGMLGATEETALKAQRAAEDGAQKLVAALQAMREANGLAEPANPEQIVVPLH